MIGDAVCALVPQVLRAFLDFGDLVPLKRRGSWLRPRGLRVRAGVRLRWEGDDVSAGVRCGFLRRWPVSGSSRVFDVFAIIIPRLVLRFFAMTLVISLPDCRSPAAARLKTSFRAGSGVLGLASA